LSVFAALLWGFSLVLAGAAVLYLLAALVLPPEGGAPDVER